MSVLLPALVVAAATLIVLAAVLASRPTVESAPHTPVAE